MSLWGHWYVRLDLVELSGLHVYALKGNVS